MEKPKIKEVSTRERILDAALDLFSKYGFHATTTRKISQLANINEVTLFRHFKRKIDLFAEMMDHIKEIGIDARKIERIDLAPKEAIKFVIRELIALLENNPREFKMMHFAGLEKVNGFEAHFIKNNVNIILNYLEKTFRYLQDAGEIASREDPFALAGMLLTQINGLVTARVISEISPLKRFSQEQLCQAVENHFLAT